MTEWDEDIAEILEKAGRLKGGPFDGQLVSLPALRALLTSAWQYGYTTGMRDSASFDDALQDRATGNTDQDHSYPPVHQPHPEQ